MGMLHPGHHPMAGQTGGYLVYELAVLWQGNPQGQIQLLGGAKGLEQGQKNQALGT